MTGFRDVYRLLLGWWGYRGARPPAAVVRMAGARHNALALAGAKHNTLALAGARHNTLHLRADLMALPTLQTDAQAQGDDVTVYLDHYLDMTGWTLSAVLRVDAGADADPAAVVAVATKTTAAGITVTAGPNGTGTRAVIDLTDGTSARLADGNYRFTVRRADAGARDIVGRMAYRVRPCD